MVVYNVTTKVEEGIVAEWLQWLKKEHIPEVIATGCFHDSKIFKLLDIEDGVGRTFTIQYFANSKTDYDIYLKEYAARVREKGFEKWGNKFIAFRSVMEVIN